MVGTGMKTPGGGLERSPPVACVVQPQPRASIEGREATKVRHPKKLAAPPRSSDGLAHSVDRILKPMSAKNLAARPLFSPPRHVVEIAPVDDHEEEYGKAVAVMSQQEEPLDLSMKSAQKMDYSAGSIFRPLPFPWFSVFPSGFCINPLPPTAAATAFLMKHSSP